jgi:hypothetical protein
VALLRDQQHAARAELREQLRRGALGAGAEHDAVGAQRERFTRGAGGRQAAVAAFALRRVQPSSRARALFLLLSVASSLPRGAR